MCYRSASLPAVPGSWWQPWALCSLALPCWLATLCCQGTGALSTAKFPFHEPRTMGSASPFVRLGSAVPAEPGGAPWFCSCSAWCFLAAQGPVSEGVQSVIVASVSASPRAVRRPSHVTSVAGQTHLCAVKRSRQLCLRVGRGVGGSQRSSQLLRRGGFCWEQTRPASWPPLRAVCPARRFVCVAVSFVSQSWGYPALPCMWELSAWCFWAGSARSVCGDIGVRQR